LAWFLTYNTWPTQDIDHINLIKTDNRLINLRLATKQENSANTNKRKKNKTGFKGISKHGNKWQARICINGERIYIGLYSTPKEAHDAYFAKLLQHYPDHAFRGN
jgi:phosphotransferase system IIB component